MNKAELLRHQMNVPDPSHNARWSDADLDKAVQAQFESDVKAMCHKCRGDKPSYNRIPEKDKYGTFHHPHIEKHGSLFCDADEIRLAFPERSERMK